MLVKVAPIGERVTEVNVEPGTTIGQCLSIAGVTLNERSVVLNNQSVDVDTAVNTEGSIIALVTKQKGGM